MNLSLVRKECLDKTQVTEKEWERGAGRSIQGSGPTEPQTSSRASRPRAVGRPQGWDPGPLHKGTKSYRHSHTPPFGINSRFRA